MKVRKDSGPRRAWRVVGSAERCSEAMAAHAPRQDDVRWPWDPERSESRSFDGDETRAKRAEGGGGGRRRRLAASTSFVSSLTQAQRRVRNIPSWLDR
jgi:hypothetical protein